MKKLLVAASELAVTASLIMPGATVWAAEEIATETTVTGAAVDADSNTEVTELTKLPVNVYDERFYVGSIDVKTGAFSVTAKHPDGFKIMILQIMMPDVTRGYTESFWNEQTDLLWSGKESLDWVRYNRFVYYSNAADRPTMFDDVIGAPSDMNGDFYNVIPVDKVYYGAWFMDNDGQAVFYKGAIDYRTCAEALSVYDEENPVTTCEAHIDEDGKITYLPEGEDSIPELRYATWAEEVKDMTSDKIQLAFEGLGVYEQKKANGEEITIDDIAKIMALRQKIIDELATYGMVEPLRDIVDDFDNIVKEILKPAVVQENDSEGGKKNEDGGGDSKGENENENEDDDEELSDVSGGFGDGSGTGSETGSGIGSETGSEIGSEIDSGAGSGYGGTDNGSDGLGNGSDTAEGGFGGLGNGSDGPAGSEGTESAGSAESDSESSEAGIIGGSETVSEGNSGSAEGSSNDEWGDTQVDSVNGIGGESGSSEHTSTVGTLASDFVVASDISNITDDGEPMEDLEVPMTVANDSSNGNTETKQAWMVIVASLVGVGTAVAVAVIIRKRLVHKLTLASKEETL